MRKHAEEIKFKKDKHTASDEQDEIADIIRERSRLYLVLAFLFVFGIVAWMFGAWKDAGAAKEVSPVSMHGYYTINGESKKYPFSDISQIDCSGVEQIVMVGQLEKRIPAGLELFFFVHREHIKVYQNGELCLDSTSTWDKKWDGYVTKGISTDDMLTISIDGMEEKEVGTSIERTLQRISYGNRYILLRQQVYRNMLKIIICFLIVILGIAELFTAMMLILLNAADVRGCISCGLFLITGALCCFIDYEYINLFITNERTLYFLDVTAQSCSCLFLMLNMMFHMHTKKSWLLGKRLILAWAVLLTSYMLGRHVFVPTMREELWLPILVSCVGVFLLIELFLLVLDYRRFHERRTSYVIFSNMFLTFCLLIEIVHFILYYEYSYYPFQIGLITYAILQYVTLFNQSKERTLRSQRTKELEKQLMESQISIMMSQIRPHFLYNSITAIQTLCVQDPEMARKSLGDFAKYLRGNMDSLASKDLIPFAKELDHTRHYVDLEQVRQGEYLEVEYHIEELNFYLPTLTMQPLVENAIEHGIGGKEDGGKVRISTWRQDNEIVVCVEDDGIGFDVNTIYEKIEGENRSHVGLKNVRDRIEKMAGGQMIIESQIGSGTKVMLVLPQKE